MFCLPGCPTDEKAMGRRGRGKKGVAKPAKQLPQSSEHHDPFEGDLILDEDAVETLDAVKRMVALFHANAISQNDKLTPDATVVYIFEVAAYCSGDAQSIRRSIWKTSGVICSQYYSRRMWALGHLSDDVGQKFFQLNLPLNFRPTNELMEEALLKYQKAGEVYDGEVVIQVSWASNSRICIFTWKRDVGRGIREKIVPTQLLFKGKCHSRCHMAAYFIFLFLRSKTKTTCTLFHQLFRWL